jgi:hypothetical protein
MPFSFASYFGGPDKQKEPGETPKLFSLLSV